MQLHYLLFDAADEEGGACSFDAMASVAPARLPAVMAEVEAVLAWARRLFGVPDEDADWNFELQETAEGGRATVALTLGGSRAFGEAFRAEFPGAAS